MSKIENRSDIWIDWVAEDPRFDQAVLMFQDTSDPTNVFNYLVKRWKRPAELLLSRAQLEREVRLHYRNIHPTYLGRLADATLIDLLKSMGKRTKLSPEVKALL